MITKVSLHAFALVPNKNEVYPSKETGENVGAAMPFANLTAHSLAIVAIVLVAAEDRAFALMLVNEGIATADKIARTATTTTSSISEKPCSPGFFDNALLALGVKR